MFITHSIPLTPPVPPCYVSFCPPLPRPISYLSPIFNLSMPHISLFALSPPPPTHIAWVQSYHPPERCPHPPASTTCPRFPPVPDGPRSSSHNPMTGFSCPYPLPFSVLDLNPGPCHIQGFSCPRVPSSLCLNPSSTHPLPPFRP